MRDEYDLSKGVRGKYAARFPANYVTVVLEPDVAAAFPDAKSLNEALRELMRARAKANLGK